MSEFARNYVRTLHTKHEFDDGERSARRARRNTFLNEVHKWRAAENHEEMAKQMQHRSEYAPSQAESMFMSTFTPALSWYYDVCQRAIEQDANYAAAIEAHRLQQLAYMEEMSKRVSEESKLAAHADLQKWQELTHEHYALLEQNKKNAVNTELARLLKCVNACIDMLTRYNLRSNKFTELTRLVMYYTRQDILLQHNNDADQRNRRNIVENTEFLKNNNIKINSALALLEAVFYSPKAKQDDNSVSSIMFNNHNEPINEEEVRRCSNESSTFQNNNNNNSANCNAMCGSALQTLLSLAYRTWRKHQRNRSRCVLDELPFPVFLVSGARFTGKTLLTTYLVDHMNLTCISVTHLIDKAMHAHALLLSESCKEHKEEKDQSGNTGYDDVSHSMNDYSNNNNSDGRNVSSEEENNNNNNNNNCFSNINKSAWAELGKEVAVRLHAGQPLDKVLKEQLVLLEIRELIEAHKKGSANIVGVVLDGVCASVDEYNTLHQFLESHQSNATGYSDLYHTWCTNNSLKNKELVHESNSVLSMSTQSNEHVKRKSFYKQDERDDKEDEDDDDDDYYNWASLPSYLKIPSTLYTPLIDSSVIKKDAKARSNRKSVDVQALQATMPTALPIVEDVSHELEHERQFIQRANHELRAALYNSVISAIIHLECTPEELFTRATALRVNSETGELYHLRFHPPPAECLTRLRPIERTELTSAQLHHIVFWQEEEWIQLSRYLRHVLHKETLLHTVNVTGPDNLHAVEQAVVEVVESTQSLFRVGQSLLQEKLQSKQRMQELIAHREAQRRMREAERLRLVAAHLEKGLAIPPELEISEDAKDNHGITCKSERDHNTNVYEEHNREILSERAAEIILQSMHSVWQTLTNVCGKSWQGLLSLTQLFLSYRDDLHKRLSNYWTLADDKQVLLNRIVSSINAIPATQRCSPACKSELHLCVNELREALFVLSTKRYMDGVSFTNQWLHSSVFLDQWKSALYEVGLSLVEAEIERFAAAVNVFIFHFSVLVNEPCAMEEVNVDVQGIYASLLFAANAHITAANPNASISLAQSIPNNYINNNNNNNNSNTNMSFNANTNLLFAGINHNNNNNDNNNTSTTSQGQRPIVKERKSTTNSTATVFASANASITNPVTSTTPTAATATTSQRKSHNKNNAHEETTVLPELSQTNIFTETVQKVKVALATFVDKFISACNENRNSSSNACAIAECALSSHVNRDIIAMLPSLSFLPTSLTTSPNNTRMKSKNSGVGIDLNIAGSSHNLTSLGSMSAANMNNILHANSAIVNIVNTRTGAIAAKCMPLAIQELECTCNRLDAMDAYLRSLLSEGEEYMTHIRHELRQRIIEMYEADARAINTAILHLRCAIERELNVPEMHLGYGTFALLSVKNSNSKLSTGQGNNGIDQQLGKSEELEREVKEQELNQNNNKGIGCMNNNKSNLSIWNELEEVTQSTTENESTHLVLVDAAAHCDSNKDAEGNVLCAHIPTYRFKNRERSFLTDVPLESLIGCATLQQIRIHNSLTAERLLFLVRYFRSTAPDYILSRNAFLEIMREDDYASSEELTTLKKNKNTVITTTEGGVTKARKTLLEVFDSFDDTHVGCIDWRELVVHLLLWSASASQSSCSVVSQHYLSNKNKLQVKNELKKQEKQFSQPPTASKSETTCNSLKPANEIVMTNDANQKSKDEQTSNSNNSISNVTVEQLHSMKEKLKSITLNETNMLKCSSGVFYFDAFLSEEQQRAFRQILFETFRQQEKYQQEQEQDVENEEWIVDAETMLWFFCADVQPIRGIQKALSVMSSCEPCISSATGAITRNKWNLMVHVEELWRVFHVKATHAAHMGQSDIFAKGNLDLLFHEKPLLSFTEICNFALGRMMLNSTTMLQRKTFTVANEKNY